MNCIELWKLMPYCPRFGHICSSNDQKLYQDVYYVTLDHLVYQLTIQFFDTGQAITYCQRPLSHVLADPRHPVSHCFTTLSVLFMGLFFLGKELSVEFRSSHKEARKQGVLFWVLFICLYTLLYDTTTPSLNDWRLNQTLISYFACRPSRQVAQTSLF